jgi:hypothetical protein
MTPRSERQWLMELCQAMSLGALIGATGALLIELIRKPAQRDLRPTG